MPNRSGFEKHVHIPRWSIDSKNPPVLNADDLVGIPKLFCSRIRDQNCRWCNIFQLSAQFRHPNYVGGQSPVLVLLKQLLLNFGSPPKTKRSGRANEHQDANFATVCVEGSS